MELSKDQMSALTTSRNEPVIAYLQRFLEHQFPAETKTLAPSELHRRCGVFVEQCIARGGADDTPILTLGEIVFRLAPELDLRLLDAGLQDCLADERFSFQERVDIVVMRQAFPLARH